jgi:hypothetical protein
VTVWLLAFNFIHFMPAFWAVFSFGGLWSSLNRTWFIGPEEIQIQTQITVSTADPCSSVVDPADNALPAQSLSLGLASLTKIL